MGVVVKLIDHMLLEARSDVSQANLRVFIPVANLGIGICSTSHWVH